VGLSYTVYVFELVEISQRFPRTDDRLYMSCMNGNKVHRNHVDTGTFWISQSSTVQNDLEMSLIRLAAWCSAITSSSYPLSSISMRSTNKWLNVDQDLHLQFICAFEIVQWAASRQVCKSWLENSVPYLALFIFCLYEAYRAPQKSDPCQISVSVASVPFHIHSMISDVDYFLLFLPLEIISLLRKYDNIVD
jgi:hypothetical protein